MNYRKKIYAALRLAEVKESDLVGKFLMESFELINQNGGEVGQGEKEIDYIVSFNPLENSVGLKGGGTYDLNNGDLYIEDDSVYVHLHEPEDAGEYYR